MLTNPKSAALISFLLYLPATILFFLILLKVKPNFGPLNLVLNGENGHTIGSKISIVLMLLLPEAFMLWIAGSIIIDQYPCWIGVPNCD
jgi:hypothetical protein